jgi:hypothetical protein
MVGLETVCDSITLTGEIREPMSRVRVRLGLQIPNPHPHPPPPVTPTRTGSQTRDIPYEFLVNNYKQALGILNSEGAFVKQMQDQGIADTSIFKDWLAEEKAYLECLSREPLEESLAMECLQKLINLGASQ